MDTSLVEESHADAMSMTMSIGAASLVDCMVVFPIVGFMVTFLCSTSLTLRRLTRARLPAMSRKPLRRRLGRRPRPSVVGFS